MHDCVDMDVLHDVVAPSWTITSPVPVCLTPFLWVGGIVEAQDPSFLDRRSISHVLNCADYTSPPPPVLSSRPYTYHQLHAKDSLDYPLLQNHMQETCAFIDDAIHKRGVVLVHCVSGMNRSVALAVGYLWLRFGLPLASTLRHLGAFRRVLTNPSFRKQLLDLPSTAAPQAVTTP